MTTRRELSPRYDAAAVEPAIYERWMAADAFRPADDPPAGAQPFVSEVVSKRTHTTSRAPLASTCGTSSRIVIGWSVLISMKILPAKKLRLREQWFPAGRRTARQTASARLWLETQK